MNKKNHFNLNETQIIIITIITMSAVSYIIGYFLSLYFNNTQLGKVVHLSFIVLFFTNFYAYTKSKLIYFFSK